MSTNQSSWPDSEQILRHQYGISVVEAQTILLAKRRQQRTTKLKSFRDGLGKTAKFYDFSRCFAKTTKLAKLRAILCKNQAKWEMKIFDLPSNFACN